RGVVHVGFRGVGNLDITAVKGRATVRARGQTQITAAQPVFLTHAGFAVGTPTSAVRHRTTGSSVSLGVRCRVLRRVLTRVAGRVVGRQQAANDLKVAQRTQGQVEKQLQAESRRVAGQGNQTIESFGLFAALGPDPASRLRLRTTAGYLEWLGRYAGETQFASPAGPPDAVRGNHAVLFQVHESAVNNSQRFIAGRLVNEADFREIVFSTFGLVPSDDEEVAGRIPASIVFAQDGPLTIAIRDGKLLITVRLDAIRGNGSMRQGGPFTVKTVYRVQVGEGPVKLIREGPIEIEPSSSTETEVVREILSRFFVSEATSDGTPPLAAVLAPAVLRLEQLSLVDGWLTLALKLDEGATSD
ncbi:MAG TPA: hypothetical protein PK867_00135, partial [Pirellulales bacterium]|nr:hypothetical protein [Pirellulales bacterium]